MKIAFFDIDGTLINVPHGLMHPSDKTKHALNEFKKQGNKIVIATARGDAPKSVQDIEFDGYICKDGHYIRYNGDILIEDFFNAQQVQTQIDVYKKYNGRPMFYGHDEEWNAFLDDHYVIEHRLMFAGTKERPEGIHEEYCANDVKALSCCVLFETVKDMWKAYHELEEEFTIVPYDSGLIRMDVYCKGFTKGTACEYLYQKLGIDYEDTYAFGDGINDVEMLKLVKYGIAMGNAIDELKEAAYDVTETVDHDGIAVYFERNFGMK